MAEDGTMIGPEDGSRVMVAYNYPMIPIAPSPLLFMWHVYQRTRTILSRRKQWSI